MRNALLAFYGTDPIVAWLLTFGAAFILAAMLKRTGTAFLDWWHDREIERADRERTRLNQILKASTPPEIHWPPARGPKGFQNDSRHRRAS